MTDFNRDKFTSKVIDEFNALQQLRKEEDAFGNITDSDERPKGCLNMFFFNTATGLGKLGFRRANRSRETVKRLLLDTQLQLIICSSLKSLAHGTDEGTPFVRNLVNVLLNASEAKELSIPLDAQLFALLADELLQEGLSNYCKKDNW